MSEDIESTTKLDKRQKTFSLPKLSWAILALGFVVGVVVLGALHFFRDVEHPVHYHANFALYVDGTRDTFKSPTNYEEVQTCGADLDNPRGRVHMHDEDPYTVHVHDAAVTWGALFDNVGYTLGDNVLKTGQGVYVSGTNGKQLTFILNGSPVFDVANRVIKDKDVLLISYGNESNAIQQKHYDAIPRTAAEHDATNDPATCSGSKPQTTISRLKSALGIGSSKHER